MGVDMRGRVHGPCVLISHRSSFLHARMEIQTEPNSTSAAEILLTYYLVVNNKIKYYVEF